ncbi:hypothetical protein NPIL_6421 [Nephila pilipes]|uniref:Uncharacterized protein n=1 Tax=Nephila pilipes TaxID=299642 RepID=A0A8X6Q4L4_NEPPI|nr:hypothetical protein NPIL_6421 [Nephila pilipes]
MTDFLNFDDLFEEVNLPVPLSPLPPTPVSSPRPMSPTESVPNYLSCILKNMLPYLLSYPLPNLLPNLLSFAQPNPEQLLHNLGLPWPNPRSFNEERILHDASGPVPKRRESLPNGAVPMKGKAPADIHLPIPDLKRPDKGISESTLVISSLLEDVSFPRLGKNPVPNFFSTTMRWRSLVAAMMASSSQTASCPTLWTSDMPRPCRNVLPISTLVRSVSPMPDQSFSFVDRAGCLPSVQGLVKAFITYQEPKDNRIFVSFSSPTWFQKKTCMDNFKRMISEDRVENRFDPDAVQWEKISQAFPRNPDRTLKNADK